MKWVTTLSPAWTSGANQKIVEVALVQPWVADERRLDYETFEYVIQYVLHLYCDLLAECALVLLKFGSACQARSLGYRTAGAMCYALAFARE